MRWVRLALVVGGLGHDVAAEEALDRVVLQVGAAISGYVLELERRQRFVGAQGRDRRR